MMNDWHYMYAEDCFKNLINHTVKFSVQPKNQYHQNPDRLNKSYLDQPYSITKLLTVALENPDRVQLEFNKKGKCSGTKIEKKFDVPIGFPQTSGYYPFPTCSVIKFELDPATQSKYYSDSKPTILMRYTLSEDSKMSQEKSSTSSQTVLYQIMLTVSTTGKKTPSTETEKTPLKSINIVTSQTAHVNRNYQPPKPTPPYQPPTNQPHTNQPPTNPIPSTILDWGQAQNQGGAPTWDWGQTQTKDVPQVGTGDKPKTKEVPQVWTGDKPKTKEVPKVGTGDKPKTKEVPQVGTGEKPKTKEVNNVGTGEKPKQRKCPMWGQGRNQNKGGAQCGDGGETQKKRHSESGDRGNPNSSLWTTPTKKRKIWTK